MNNVPRFAQLCISCLTLTLFLQFSQGAEDLGYVLAPLRTELHRSEISSKASAILVVNTLAFAMDRTDDAETARFETLEKDLNTLADGSKAMLLVRIQQTAGQEQQKELTDILKERIKKLANKCGYLELQFSSVSTSAKWDSGTGSLGTGLLDDPGDENLIVNDLLIAAPLRTRISKLQVAMGDAFIKLRQSIDGRNLDLSEQTKDAVRDGVNSMQLQSKNRLVFKVSSTQAGAEVIDSLFSNRQPPAIPKDAPAAIKALLLMESERFKASSALKLAQELGFQEIGYTHSPNGGAPELLIEAIAPDFELKGLDGKAVKWSEWRGDRPALISFWGVACGPCRLEAPHLTEIHKKFGARIAILAINAYDESAEEILEYVTKEKLTHPIVVGGKKLASSQYKVGAFPTTFWVGRNGKVVRYIVGFESGEQLEAEVVDFINAETP